MVRYSERFYEAKQAGSRSSATAVVGYLEQLGLAKWSRVLDVGCGRGNWLAAFGEAGATTLVGVDGSWNSPHFEELPSVRFIPADLEALANNGTTLVNETFDVAICLEAAEHLSPEAGAGLVGFLAASAPFVLFSAAVPGQGGTGHQNEQWPTYWAEHFLGHGLQAHDLLRPLIWDDDCIDYWYRQNLLLFARPGILDPHSASPVESLNLVHPELLAARRAEPLPGDWARGTVRAARRTLAELRSRLRR